MQEGMVERFGFICATVRVDICRLSPPEGERMKVRGSKPARLLLHPNRPPLPLEGEATHIGHAEILTDQDLACS
jgi:hypothetical protein